MTKNTIFITGAGGSVGEILVKSFSSNKNLNLILLDRDEHALYFLKEKNKKCNAKIAYVLGDIKDKETLSYVFKSFTIDTVIHCAAYKQVPLMEEYVYELIKNNMEGLFNVISLSSKFKVKKFIFFSTDKAVYPNNLMGITKRLGEILVAFYDAKNSASKFLSLRLTNLLNSKGSVLPLFEEQYKIYNKIFLTSIDAKRYITSNLNLLKLVNVAMNYKGSKNLLVCESKKEVYIKDIAEIFLKRKGITNANDYIELTRLRKGDKVIEQLFYTFENPINIYENTVFEVGLGKNIDENIDENILNLIHENKHSLQEISKKRLQRMVKIYI